MAESIGVTGGSATAAEAPRPAGARLARGGVGWVLSGLLVVALVAGAWWYHGSATAFDAVEGWSVTVSPSSIGTPYHFDVNASPLPPVTVTRAEVRLADGSGPAALGVSACERATIGSTSGPLAPWGTGCTGLEGTDLADLPQDTAAIIVTVVPLSDQAVTVTGLRLAFRDGWRTGEQTLPLDLVVAPPSPRSHAPA